MNAPKKEIWAWAAYDFANSPFSTTVTTVVFNVYFVSVVAGDSVRLLGREVPGASLWAYLVAFSTLCIALVSPFLGAVADCAAAKKKFLALFTLARLAAGKLDATRRATFDSTWLVWLYTAAQGLAMLRIS